MRRSICYFHITVSPGLAPVAGMCNPTSSCTVNEGRHFESVYVVAHEIGHKLVLLLAYFKSIPFMNCFKESIARYVEILHSPNFSFRQKRTYWPAVSKENLSFRI